MEFDSNLPTDKLIIDRSKRLFRFLRELSELRSKTIRSINSFDEVLWMSDIPEHKYCFNIARTPNSEAEKWIEIKNPHLKPFPDIPKTIYAWVDVEEISNSSCKPGVPQIKDSIPKFLVDGISSNSITEKSESKTEIYNVEEDDTGSDNQPQTIENNNTEIETANLVDYPDIRLTYQTYIENEWTPWALKDRELRPVQNAYEKLFSIFQKQQRLGESYEVVVGLGLLTWKVNGIQEIKRHLITAKVNLSFNAEKGLISLLPSDEGLNLLLEQDMLDAPERIDASITYKLEQQLKDLDEDIWTNNDINTILTSWINCHPKTLGYNTTIDFPNSTSNLPELRLAPAVILRRRSERNLVRALKEIENQLGEETATVPKGVVDIVRDPDTKQYFPGEELLRKLSTDDYEIYFPLLYNDQQLQIIKRSNHQDGLLVQGPPGTGKSHTIANLISHFLATGQRVLVTSHTPRALTVLTDKIPKDISALCVMVLSDDSHSRNSLENSVKGITNKYTTWSNIEKSEEIHNLEVRLDDVRKSIQKEYNDIKSFRELETQRYDITFGKYCGTLQSIAQVLYEDENKYSWFIDKLSEDAECPLSNNEVINLLNLIRTISSELDIELNLEIPTLSDILNPQEFNHLVKEEKELQNTLLEMSEPVENPKYKQITKLSSETVVLIHNKINEIVTLFNRIISEDKTWANDVMYTLLIGSGGYYNELKNISEKQLNLINGKIESISGLIVSGLPDENYTAIKEQVHLLEQHLKLGKKTSGFSTLFLPKDLKNTIKVCSNISINGRRCTDLVAVSNLIDWLEININFGLLDKLWENINRPAAPALSIRKVLYENQLQIIKKCIEMHELRKDVQVLFRDNNIPDLNWKDTSEIVSTEYLFRNALIRNRLKEISVKIKETEIFLDTSFDQEKAHEIVNKLSLSIHSRNPMEYSKSYLAIEELNRKKDDQKKRDLIATALKIHVPLLLNEITKNPNNDIWDNCLSDFEGAWDWAKTSTWLERMSNPKTIEVLQRKYEENKRNEKEIIAELAAEKAWTYCISRLSESSRYHLQAWMLSMKAIGAGKGKNANRHRRDARNHLEKCRSAIPAWIMPIYRVAETIEMQPDIFDVVIVDEASQSGPEALFLQYLAKKIIVVGDDKQIKPEFVGIKSEDVEMLRQKLIKDLPLGDRMGIDHSFFDQAMIRYSNPTCLQEHFRCMPEIIQFSNNLCYQQNPLIPLKQYGAGRLTPVLRKVYVDNGYQTGSSSSATNKPEAERIVEQIHKCCNDPQYSGKTFGVISLLGSAQAEFIKRRLIQTIGAEEMDKRNLTCGDAYDFQGDERDVIFLSLVVAPSDDGKRIHAYTSADAERRFNVAASRAKEQMWLFHSATLNDLTNPNCLRHKLVSYFEDPQSITTEIPGSDLSVEKLRMIKMSADKSVEDAPSPFDSWFEVEVFIMLVDLGFRVTPQLKIAGYKIDLVVEGMRGRIAVECDGDRWHGPENYDKDMERQRQLERSGFIFWRIKGSSYFRNPKKSMEDLNDFLLRNGISPNGNFTSSFKTDDNKESQLENDPNISGTVPDEEIEDDYDEKSTSSNIPNFVANTPESTLPTKIIEYHNWREKVLPHPREVDLDDISVGLISIIEEEGPIKCYRAYTIYARACGIMKISNEIKLIFDAAIRRLIKNKTIEAVDEFEDLTYESKIVRIADSPSVQLRTRGDREFHEIPPSEVAALMIFLCSKDRNLRFDKSSLFREVLNTYDLVRMTKKVNYLLEVAFYKSSLMEMGN